MPLCVQEIRKAGVALFSCFCRLLLHVQVYYVMMNFHTLFDFPCTMTTRQTGTKQFEIACSGDMHMCALLCHAQLTFVWRSTTQLS